MPAITKSSGIVLVTGATGFIGSWVVDSLLRSGYSVRATIRNEEKGKHLLKLFKSYGDKFQLHAIGDMSLEGAFDDAVKGVVGIIHTASPVNLTAVEPKEVIEPAVNGVTEILSSAVKYGSSVQRIVITSSCAAIVDVCIGEKLIVSEANWNDAAVAECEEKGKDALGTSKYAASKTLAEKAAWNLYHKHKSEINWDISVINPSFVFGPIIREVTTAESLTSSFELWYDAVIKGDFGGSPLTMPGNGWADVRDVAEAHVHALEVPAAGDERIIIGKDPFVWQDWIDAANSLSPHPYPSRTLAKGTPGVAYRSITYDTSKLENILRIKPKTKEETVRDILADYARRGW